MKNIDIVVVIYYVMKTFWYNKYNWANDQGLNPKINWCMLFWLWLSIIDDIASQKHG